MSRKPRQKRRTRKKVTQEITNEKQGKSVMFTVIGLTILLLIVLYFSFKSFAG